MTATVLSRSERRKAETRRRLMEAAADVYARVGVEGATIGAITQPIYARPAAPTGINIVRAASGP